MRKEQRYQRYRANNYFTVTTAHDVKGVVRDYIPFDDTNAADSMVAAIRAEVAATSIGRTLIRVSAWRVTQSALAALWDKLPGIACPRVGV